MKFSYSLLKKLVPEIKSSDEIADKLTMGLFEIDEVSNNTIDVKVLPNRYSDAASHWGLAREIAAMYGVKYVEPKARPVSVVVKKKIPVSIETKACRRMMARYFDSIKLAPSPAWMRKVLVSCGMRPINNLVDITNYVSLETGQPLHAFDFEKMKGGKLIVRQAKSNETVELLDGAKVHLDSTIAVLADTSGPLDVAGVKGGKRAEISAGTKTILLTAGNFDGVSIYKASRKTGIQTDSSLRFSHNLSPELAEIGIERASELIHELCGGKAGLLTDVYLKKMPRRVIKFNINLVNKLLGTNISKGEAFTLLRRIGFIAKDNFIIAPPLRTDVATIEDLTEEIGRLYGYDKILPVAPCVSLTLVEEEPRIILKDKVCGLMLGFGFDEVYNTSFVDQGVIEVINPIASDKSCLRSTLAPLLLKNVEDNFRFFDEVKIFEIGNVFRYPGKQIKDTPGLEALTLGIAFGLKDKETFFDLKGVLERLLQRLWANVEFRPRIRKNISAIEIIVSGKEVGYASRVRNGVSIAEINLDALVSLANRDVQFKPFPKYPAVIRDISVVVPINVRVGDVLELINALAVKNVEDIDLIDYFDNFGGDPQKKSLTFRIIFRSSEKTLTGEEVEKEFSKISQALTESLKAVIR